MNARTVASLAKTGDTAGGFATLTSGCWADWGTSSDPHEEERAETIKRCVHAYCGEKTTCSLVHVADDNGKHEQGDRCGPLLPVKGGEDQRSGDDSGKGGEAGSGRRVRRFCG